MDRLALLGIGAAVAAMMMLALWLIQVRTRNASAVDVGWTYGVGLLAVLYAALGDGAAVHRILIAVLAGAWSLRLGTYLLLNRVLGKEEDGRYRALRAKWGSAANRRFLVFFEAQAALVVVFSLPFLFVVFNGHERLEPLEWVGVAVWTVGLAGESLADRQLASWRADPGNRGRTCRAGLWRYSRHPNYFFEFTIWIAFALIATAALWGWIAWVAPALLLFLLFRVTGIPAGEAQALRSRRRGLPALPAGDERLRAVVSEGSPVVLDYLVWREASSREGRWRPATFCSSGDATSSSGRASAALIP